MNRYTCKENTVWRVMLLRVEEHQSLPANYQRLEERNGADSPSIASAGANPAYILTQDF